ncbi:flavin-dependent dehydrogenase [Thermosynechococcaceae cyanobacterium BACA0444]|uniref:Flavin-dependent dehydrogenase n=1 Tax=Pseudocalidococcus azoricus BACA0444 TaxID=2918990 RepID=A0AAE4JVW1_9CYAN|nr:flavin-dependent dehydrogenase [Pseudocalidococcus azoricus]MDS3860775.1 flavin-dependent dehydrogenase [Pseudocalidococcus azoricus BACA0444]
MQEILYLEVPTPVTTDVQAWLQSQFQPFAGQIQATTAGIRWQFPGTASELSVFAWSLQRTTYLKVFRWGQSPVPQESSLLQHLKKSLHTAFPLQHPEPPEIDLSQNSIFTALEPFYPRTVKYFQQMPNGEADLQRVYWWEQRWRQGVRHPQAPQQVVSQSSELAETPNFDLIYIGGALGVVHAAVMARLGYRVLLLERLPFGRMNREWNISRAEFQHLIDLGLFTAAEFASIIAREYVDGFNQFFAATTPKHCQAPILHTPTVLNIALDSSRFLQLCGQKLRQAGGEIWDETEFIKATVHPNAVQIQATHRPTAQPQTATGRLLVDAMGTASPIAWQLNGGRAFDSVCPTVGAIISGLDPQVWDADYGDVLNSHGDLSRGRQLIWELFPAAGDELTIYLFHYHKVHPDNPGSLLEMYEDFFEILPEYRRCDLDDLAWIKPTFGYIPGHFSLYRQDRTIAFDRLVTIGDAASLQSPLVFTGFGSLVRNLPRLTDLLQTALKHDLLQSEQLNQIRAFQSNTAVTWLFSRGMMVPTGRNLPPNRVNAMLNTFFGILAGESPELADRFIKDRAGWWPFNRMAITAAWKNPGLLYWIWDMVGPWDMTRWLGSYFTFTWAAFLNALFGAWLPGLIRKSQAWLEPKFPQVWFRLLCWSYDLTYSVGQPRIEQTLPTLPRPGTTLPRPMVTAGTIQSPNP